MSLKMTEPTDRSKKRYLVFIRLKPPRTFHPRMPFMKIELYAYDKRSSNPKINPDTLSRISKNVGDATLHQE